MPTTLQSGTQILYTISTDHIRIRDPFVVADRASMQYYLFGTTDADPWNGVGIGFQVYRSRDLKLWSEPEYAGRLLGNEKLLGSGGSPLRRQLVSDRKLLCREPAPRRTYLPFREDHRTIRSHFGVSRNTGRLGLSGRHALCRRKYALAGFLP